MKTWMVRVLLAALLLSSARAWAQEQQLLTVAEQSNYQATARHADVVAFGERLARLSPLVRLGELGSSGEGRKLPFLVVADPPVATAAEAAKSGKLVVLAIGALHAGEVDGKEALLQLGRDLALEKSPLLQHVVVVLVPLLNADGNERMARSNRPHQAGPAEVGERVNGQGLDLNRDFMKLETPEVRALVKLLRDWDPAVVVDTHTTNGSYHRYTLTYDGPRHPAVAPRLVEAVRDGLLPSAGRRLEKQTGQRSFFYGNFTKEHTRWEPYAALPRYGTQYVGLRGRMAVLSEGYVYAPYRDRVLATRGFLRGILEHVAEHREQLGKLLREVRSSDDREGRVVLRHRLAPAPQPATVLGFVEEVKDGKRVATKEPRDYRVEHLDRTEPVLAVRRPFAYLLPARLERVVENLQRHGLAVEELREDIELDVEVYRVQQVSRARDLFQKHALVTVEATPRSEARRVPAGTVLVRTSQPLGTLAALLLEPQSEDGLCTWNFFDDVLQEGQDFPVLRLVNRVPLVAGKVRPLAEERVRDRPITFDLVYGSDGHPFSLGGSPVSGLTWLDDGQHFLQRKEDRLLKVHALTGRSQPLYDSDVLAQALGKVPTIGAEAAGRLARSRFLHLNPQRTGTLLEHENDLYFAALDGSTVVRLTRTPGKEELPSFSPDGQFVAFVRDSNLYVVDLATQAERALTTDGGGLVSNGKADWVYFEEVFNRNWRAYWWSPDGRQLAFLRFDDTPVHKFVVTDAIPTRQEVETTAYPKAGDPNPLVRLGAVTVGGSVRWVDLANYSETARLITRVGWTPDGKTLTFHVQDRAQTWLDFCTVADGETTPKRLFRETTRAWVDDPGEAKFLKDGSFLLASDRTGWRHLYLYDRDGKTLRPLTSGPWEVREVHLVDEAGGWVYFSGTRDSALASHLYRVRLDGAGLERLTSAPGDHEVTVSPRGNLFIDAWSNRTTPTTVHLLYVSGAHARTLDTNPVHEREEYRLSKPELVQVTTPDGFVLECLVLKPPDFDPKRRYPVWVQTYGGPYSAGFPSQTVRDSWGGGRVADQLLAQLGFVVFRTDPRSASGKGTLYSWGVHRRLGVQELKDLEAAVAWLAKQPWADAARIGLSGASYGGFLTAYALTHSKAFAAGVSVAPVTDWRNYDSIYTERYMNTPQENPEGYDATSVVKAARNLHGRLLLVHGHMDDNVHVQNALQLMDALQRAGKSFEVMIYPRARHGRFGKHYQRLVIDFMQRALRPEPRP